MTEDEFIRRFVDYMVEHAGFLHFADGTPLRYYAEEIAAEYWLESGLDTSPEDCAAADIADWNDDEGDEDPAL